MAVVVLLVAIITIVIVSAGKGINDASKKAKQSAARSCAGKTYPDQQKHDICADASNTVALGGLAITATPFTPRIDAVFGKALCTNVTIKNTSSKSQDYNVLDFKAQTPSGDVATTSTLNFAGTLDSGVLIGGGTKKGLVCTDDKGDRGEYVFIYKPNPFQPDRGIWLFRV